LGGGGGDLFARKKYAMPECVSVEIGVQTHSKCAKNESTQKDSYIKSLHTINSLNLVNLKLIKRKSSSFYGVR